MCIISSNNVLETFLIYTFFFPCRPFYCLKPFFGVRMITPNFCILILFTYSELSTKQKKDEEKSGNRSRHLMREPEVGEQHKHHQSNSTIFSSSSPEPNKYFESQSSWKKESPEEINRKSRKKIDLYHDIHDKHLLHDKHKF